MHVAVNGSLAVAAVNPAVVETLLAGGANPAARDVVGKAPLHEAARNANPAVVEALLAGGADPTVRDERGWTPLHYVAEGSLCRVFSSSCRDANPAAVIEALLAAGANLEARDGRRRPTFYGRHVRDLGGGTPLHAVAGSSSEKTAPPAIRALLTAGADMDARDEGGNTPLHRAAAGPGDLHAYQGNPYAGSAVEVLLDAGASPTVRNAEGRTPWDLAQENQALNGSAAYWRLNDARFDAPTTPSRRP